MDHVEHGRMMHAASSRCRHRAHTHLVYGVHLLVEGNNIGGWGVAVRVADARIGERQGIIGDVFVCRVPIVARCMTKGYV